MSLSLTGRSSPARIFPVGADLVGQPTAARAAAQVLQARWLLAPWVQALLPCLLLAALLLLGVAQQQGHVTRASVGSLSHPLPYAGTSRARAPRLLNPADLVSAAGPLHLEVQGSRRAAFVASSALSQNTARGSASPSACAGTGGTYTVASGQTLSSIGALLGTSWETLASLNHLANPNVIFPGQRLCLPAGVGSTRASPPQPVVAMPACPAGPSTNLFPYGQCTWWANQRYFQLHGVYVPWTTDSDAWQWTARALQFGWKVDSRPSVGAIIDLQPWVQGAYGLGHVAVVERLLGNGDVIASTMNWGAHPLQVTSVEFAPGPGVTFISR